MDRLIEKFFAWFFVPPRAPVELLPIGSRFTHMTETFRDFGTLCYAEGVKDGLAFGLIGSLFLILAVVVVTLIIRASKGKGLLNVFLTLF